MCVHLRVEWRNEICGRYESVVNEIPSRVVKEFSMAELVERTGVAAATVRYYLASELLPPPRRAKSNRFLYDERHVEVIRLIRLLQERRNLSLETIGKMLPDLLPDLLGAGEANVFRREMWGQLLEVHFPTTSLPSPADRLLEAGLAAFARRGYADVSVDDVCQAAGIAKGSFYRHFPAKEELFFAVVTRVGEVIAAQIAAAGSLGVSATLLGEALSPYLALVCDLASLASQRRPGYLRALRGLLARLASEVDGLPHEVEVPTQSSWSLVEQAIASAIGAMTHEQLPEVAQGE
jgi:AcrR family transcriptional regulator